MAIRTRLSTSATPGRPYAAWVAKAETVISKVVAIVLNAYNVAVELNDLSIATTNLNDLNVSVEVE